MDQILFGRNPPGYDTRERPNFRRWLRSEFDKNTPIDELVRLLLKAEGSSVDDGAPLYFVQYSRKPQDAAVAISQTFLGIQLQCARCHDHPYEKWKQKDFFAFAAFLERLQPALQPRRLKMGTT